MTPKWLMGVLAWLKAWWIFLRFGRGYHIRGTLKRQMGVLAWLKAWWIRTRNQFRCCLAGEEMPAKVVILAQFGHGYYILGTLKWLMGVLVWLKASWIFAQGLGDPSEYETSYGQEIHAPVASAERNAHKSHDFGSVWARILYPWEFEMADGFFGLAQGILDLYECETSHRSEIHATVTLPERKCPQKS
ncbi:hypothetical protein C8R44DRAFT_744003 [Mycena epipterygia]|nr:hypothetical protein C8R44DRAFT_744003 [Mycena epipterygia]